MLMRVYISGANREYGYAFACDKLIIMEEQ